MPLIQVPTAPPPEMDDPPLVMIGDETFEMLPEAPVGALLWLARGRSSTASMVSFMAGCLRSEDDVERLETALSSREQVVSRAALEDAFDRLVDFYADRPTTSPEASRFGQTPPDTGSTVALLATASS